MTDKLKHLIIGFIMGLGLCFLIPHFPSFWIVSAIGAGKEFLDSGLPDNSIIRKKLPFMFSPKRTMFDNSDLFATTIGGFIGVILHWFIF